MLFARRAMRLLVASLLVASILRVKKNGIRVSDLRTSLRLGASQVLRTMEQGLKVLRNAVEA